MLFADGKEWDHQFPSQSQRQPIDSKAVADSKLRRSRGGKPQNVKTGASARA